MSEFRKFYNSEEVFNTNLFTILLEHLDVLNLSKNASVFNFVTYDKNVDKLADNKEISVLYSINPTESDYIQIVKHPLSQYKYMNNKTMYGVRIGITKDNKVYMFPINIMHSLIEKKLKVKFEYKLEYDYKRFVDKYLTNYSEDFHKPDYYNVFIDSDRIENNRMKEEYEIKMKRLIHILRTKLSFIPAKYIVDGDVKNKILVDFSKYINVKDMKNKDMNIEEPEYANVIRKYHTESVQKIPKVLLLFGIPGSGKSRYCKEINKDGHWKIVSPDNLRREICGDVSCQDRNYEIFKIAKEQLIKNIENGHDTILDVTGVSANQRRFFFSDLPCAVEKLVHVINVNAEVAKARIKNDIKNGVDRSNCPDFAVDRMYNNFKSNIGLLDKEGFKKI